MSRALEPDEVLAGLYEAAAMPEQWEHALTNLAILTRSRVTHVLNWTAATGMTTWGVVGWCPGAEGDPEADDRYRRHYAALDPRPKRALAASGTVWNCVEELGETIPVASAEIYNDFLIPNGARWTTNISQHVGNGQLLTISSMRGHKDAPYGEDEKQRLGIILPHLCRLERVRKRLSEQTLSAGLSIAAFEAMSLGVVICDAAAKVLYANPAALDIAAGSTLTISRGRVGSKLANVSIEIERRIRLAAQPRGRANCGIGGALRVDGGTRQDDVFILFAPLADAAVPNTLSTSPAVALFLESGRNRSRPRGEHLSQWFGLTPSEAALVGDLLDGKQLDEVSAERSVQISTLRTHLKQVLSKAGVRRQAELMALVARLPRHQA
jgi:DNA-binding CsgD family transcriptional regulator